MVRSIYITMRNLGDGIFQMMLLGKVLQGVFLVCIC